MAIQTMGEHSISYPDDHIPNIEQLPNAEELKGFPTLTGEFWTSKQRQASSIHEISYRACFKPQLPHFFIERFTKPDDLVYDPFAGRGTTAIESGLMGRRIIANDVNPLSKILTYPRFLIPYLNDLSERLRLISTYQTEESDIDLSMFFHPDTMTEILKLRSYLQSRRKSGDEDAIDAWIRMIATSRLSGHSSGFFSVYTLPPNQAISPERQRLINEKRKQAPEYRDTSALITRKTRSLVSSLSAEDIENLARYGSGALLLSESADATHSIPNDCVALTVTSPPFLDVVQYSTDNWLRCWFNCIDIEQVEQSITMARTVDEWRGFIGRVLVELHRVTRSGGRVAFEVGEVRGGRIKLEEYVIPAGIDAGFRCIGLIINEQSFTKTANIWGVSNNSKGTNSNRIVLFQKT